MSNLQTHPSGAPRPLADRLRETVQAARGDLQVRARLTRLVAEPAWLEKVVRETGPNHAVVRDLLEIASHVESRERRAA